VEAALVDLNPARRVRGLELLARRQCGCERGRHGRGAQAHRIERAGDFAGLEWRAAAGNDEQNAVNDFRHNDPPSSWWWLIAACLGDIASGVPAVKVRVVPARSLAYSRVVRNLACSRLYRYTNCYVTSSNSAARRCPTGPRW